MLVTRHDERTVDVSERSLSEAAAEEVTTPHHHSPRSEVSTTLTAMDMKDQHLGQILAPVQHVRICDRPHSQDGGRPHMIATKSGA